MSIARYTCSQPALYMVSKNVIQSLSQNLPAFAAFKAKYTGVHLMTLNNALELAEHMPDFQTRKVQSDINFRNLCIAHAECCNLWQNLKRYFKTAYNGEELKLKLEEAGAGYYKKTVARNWDAANTLLTNTKMFLNKHSSELEANQNMPASFPATLNTAHTNFSKNLLTFQQTEKNIKTSSSNKINANNHLFALITEICQDGQQIFKTNPILKSQFIFNTILNKVTVPKNMEEPKTEIQPLSPTVFEQGMTASA